VIKTIATSTTGYKAIAVNILSNKVYIANQGAGSVTVIDGATNAVLRNIAVPGCPTGIDVNPFTNRIYVSSQCTGDNLYVIDGSSDALASAVIPLGGVASIVRVDAINNRIYARSDAYTVVVNGNTNQVISR